MQNKLTMELIGYKPLYIMCCFCLCSTSCCDRSIDIIVCTVIDLLTVEPHTPTPEPVRYDKKDGQWYSHDGVDVTETQKRKGYCSELHVYVCHREYFNFSVIYTSLSSHNL